MTIRCNKCHDTIWVQPAQTDSGTAAVSCGTCGQTFCLRGLERFRESGRDLAERAREVAREHGTDLPSACSLLLGILSPEALRDVKPVGDPADPADPAPSFNYDRSFQHAIDRGWLSGRQASERGKRAAYVEQLNARHGLAQSVAEQVADNRISLIEALRSKSSRADASAIRVAVAPPRRRSSRRGTPLLVALVLAAAALVWATRDRVVPSTLPAGTQILENGEVTTDRRGQVLEVRGDAPFDVLRAFCSTFEGGMSLLPLGVVPTSVPGGRVRLGLARPRSGTSDLVAIRIVEDRDQGCWFAGDGASPLRPDPAPAGAARAVRPR